MKAAPVFPDEALLLPPVNEMNPPTSGSAKTTWLTASWRPRIEKNEISCDAWEKPAKSPTSCCGKRPFGMIT
jgi:hypothetical protein